MKRVISTPRLLLLSSYVILIARASAEVSEGLKKANNSHSQRRREATGLNVTTPNFQSQPAQDLGSFLDKDDYVWGGVVQFNIPEYGGTFDSIDNVQWIIPNVRVPLKANGEKRFGVSVWAGIDGAGNCPGRVLQAGTFSEIVLDDSGIYQTYVTAFVEWYPREPATLDFVVKTGHTVLVSILASSSSESAIKITNLSTGTDINVNLVSPGDAYNLCGLTVEYVVEAPFNTDTNANYLLPQFDDVVFSNCKAETSEGFTVDLTDASLYTLVTQSGRLLETPNIVSATEAQVTYVSSGLSKG